MDFDTWLLNGPETLPAHPTDAMRAAYEAGQRDVNEELLEAAKAAFDTFKDVPHLEQPDFNQPPEPVSEHDADMCLVLGLLNAAIAKADKVK